jgi:hypothetical protein
MMDAGRCRVSNDVSIHAICSAAAVESLCFQTAYVHVTFVSCRRYSTYTYLPVPSAVLVKCQRTL